MNATAVVVDDSPIEAGIMQGLLQQLGVQVLAIANDGIKGLAEIERHQPTICTLDINLPMMSGLEVVRIVREKKIPTKVLMCSGIGTAGVTSRALASGADAFVRKPFDSLATKAAIAKVLDG